MSSPSGLTRRGLLASAASLGVGAGLGFAGAEVLGDNESSGQEERTSDRVEFYGPHQAGIATPAAEFLSFAAFDLSGRSGDDLRSLLREWTGAARELAAGEHHRPGEEDDLRLPPRDPGEADDLSPARLTLTFGFGPGMFGDELDSLGLGASRPPALASLPAFRGESLKQARSGGDLCVQACADDPQVAFHSIHVLTRIAEGAAVLRWSQEGFGRTSSSSRSQPTPRNLMGFKDGTNNIRSEDSKAMEEHVWVQPGDGPDWMEGGTYMVARRIKILLDVWDATSLEGQERAIGREKLSGAPLGGAMSLIRSTSMPTRAASP